MGVLGDWGYVIPEIGLLTLTCVALIADLYCNPKGQVRSYAIGLIGLILAAAYLIYLGLPTFAGEAPKLLFNDMLVLDKVSFVSKLFILLNLFVIFVYSRDYVREKQMPETEFYLLSLFATMGMMVMVSSHNLLVLYLGLELMSLPLYALVAMHRNSMRSSEAAMKYFVMGALASGMLLYGISIVYGLTTSLDIGVIAQAVKSQALMNNWVMVFSLVFIIAGLAFKVGAVPFHMWIPDIYQGAPAVVALLVSSSPKIAALIMMMRVLSGALPDLIQQWQGILILLSVLSMGLGNFIAIMQTNIRRLLAYSAIAHMGYMLLGMLTGTALGYSAALFYILIYSLMSLGGFGMITLLSREGIDINEIDDLKGLNTRNPWLAFMMMLLMFSMAGIPPTVGFFSKFWVLQSVIQAGYVWLAVLALLFAVVGAYYYIRVIRVVYFEAPETEEAFMVSKPAGVMMSVNGLAMLMLGLMPGALIVLCRSAFGVG